MFSIPFLWIAVIFPSIMFSGSWNDLVNLPYPFSIEWKLFFSLLNFLSPEIIKWPFSISIDRSFLLSPGIAILKSNDLSVSDISTLGE
jgi:hypothetical protein